VSIARDSGGRHRPVDLSPDDGEEIVINGTRLKQARVERGLSVIDAARMVTLSREQVEQIENGGLGAFYGARHKLLAARKYSDSLAIALEDLMPPPPPPPPPVEVAVAGRSVEPEPSVPATPKPATRPPKPVSEPLSAAVATPTPEASITSEAAPVTPAATEPSLSQPSSALVQRVAAVVDATVSSDISQATVKRLPLALVVGAALILVFSILRGLTPETKPVELRVPDPMVESPAASDTVDQAAAEPIATPEVVAAPALVAPAAPDNPAAQTMQVVANPSPAVRESGASDACALTAGPDTPRWAPPQARNASTRLFMTSNAPLEVCVTDAAGVSTSLQLKPGAMTSATGKPPYIVRSERLPQAQIFLQGLKVRVPASATAVHLITTQSVRSPETAEPAEQ
jgi:transcriptional regulator with XRE-family HTH domain